eukprot:827494-Amphidinium_carterae.1
MSGLLRKATQFKLPAIAVNVCTDSCTAFVGTEQGCEACDVRLAGQRTKIPKMSPEKRSDDQVATWKEARPVGVVGLIAWIQKACIALNMWLNI